MSEKQGKQAGRRKVVAKGPGLGPTPPSRVSPSGPPNPSPQIA